MIGPWQLLALRENETAMDVSSIAGCMQSLCTVDVSSTAGCMQSLCTVDVHSDVYAPAVL